MENDLSPMPTPRASQAGIGIVPMASKRPTDINLDTTDYRVRGEDGKYRMRPDRGLNRIMSIVALAALALFYFGFLTDILERHVYLVIVAFGFMAGGTFTMSLKHLDW